MRSLAILSLGTSFYGHLGSNVGHDGESTDISAIGVGVPDFHDAAHETGNLEKAQVRGERRLVWLPTIPAMELCGFSATLDNCI